MEHRPAQRRRNRRVPAARESNRMQTRFTYKQVCERLAIARSTLFELVRAGLLTRVYLQSPRASASTRSRGIPRITRESIERYEAGIPATASTARHVTTPTRSPHRSRIARSSRDGLHFR